MRIFFLILLFFFLPFTNQAQSRSEIAVYNIGLGAFAGGIGAVINKKKHQETGKVFLKGFWQGALGGYLVYESKNLIRLIPTKKEWAYSWGSKFVNAAGTSIIANAASNRNFWEQWHLHIGFNRLEIYTQDGFKIKYKIMPVSFALTIITAFDSKFELERTLQTGEIIFSRNNLLLSKNVNAYAYGNLIVFDTKNLNNYEVFSHETIHVYQYYDYNFINTYFNETFLQWSKKSKIFEVVNSIFYIDLQGPFLRGLYLLEDINQENYYDNFFEYEAEFFATGDNVSTTSN